MIDQDKMRNALLGYLIYHPLKREDIVNLSNLANTLNSRMQLSEITAGDIENTIKYLKENSYCEVVGDLEEWFKITVTPHGKRCYYDKIKQPPK